MEEKKLTSLKLPPNLLDDFKVACVRTKLTLQQLAERSIYLYLTDEDFRQKINNQLNTRISSSIL